MASNVIPFPVRAANDNDNPGTPPTIATAAIRALRGVYSSEGAQSWIREHAQCLRELSYRDRVRIGRVAVSTFAGRGIAA